MAFSAVSKAMKQKDMVAVVRYCYNARSTPRMGILVPLDNLEEEDEEDNVTDVCGPVGSHLGHST